MEQPRVPVKRRALEERLKRHFYNKEDSIMRKSRPGVMLQEYGVYYTIDFHNHINGGFDDLEAEAKDRGVLRPFEYLEKE